MTDNTDTDTDTDTEGSTTDTASTDTADDTPTSPIDLIRAHEDSVAAKLTEHTTGSAEKLDVAVDNTSEVIGKVAGFVGRHVPEPFGRQVVHLAARARTALDEDHVSEAGDTPDDAN